MNTIYEYYFWNRVCAEGVGKGQRTGVDGLILMTCINIQHIQNIDCFCIKGLQLSSASVDLYLFYDGPVGMQIFSLFDKKSV